MSATKGTTAAAGALEAPKKTAAAARRDPRHALWDPFGLVRRFTEELEHTFELPHGFGEVADAAWSPQVEVVEREGMLVVRADLPGVKTPDVSVEIDGRTLTIKGERHAEHEEKNETAYRSERSYGGFYRSFRLPERADASRVTAAFKDGVLEVEVPLTPKTDPAARKVDIRTIGSV